MSARSWPALRVFRFGGAAVTEGVEKHRIEGEQVRVYSVPKTIADLFKYRNKVGLDVALEAPREGWRAKRFTMDEIHRTIHPFLDGNGRVGRLLIALVLVDEGVLREPLLYLSLYFNQHRQAYYEHLDQVRERGAWDRWLRFFAEGVRETAEEAVATARRLSDLFARDLARVHAAGRGAGSAATVLSAFRERPMWTIAKLREVTGLPVPTVTRAVEALQALGIVRETTGRRRGRVFSYDAYLRILSEGTEPL